jgi:AbrB family looped-hinge helix DNA binding protein
MKLTTKGQVTFPQRLRNRYGLKPQTEVVFEETADGVLIKPAASGRVAQLRSAMKKSRGSAAIESTAELMKLTRDDG